MVADESGAALDAVGNYYRQARQSGPAPPVHTPPEGLLPAPQSWVSSMFDPQPRWDFRAEALWLQPNFDDSAPLALQAQSTGTSFILAPVGVRANGDMTTSVRGTVEYHWNELGSIEASGFWMDGPNQSQYSLSDQDQTYYFDGTAQEANERGFMTNTPPGFPLISTVATVDWSFLAWGAETNLLHHFVCMRGPVSDLAVGFGGRYLRIEESVDVYATNELDDLFGVMSVTSKNNVYGPQFVGRARVNGPGMRIRWLFEGKIGLMANSTTHDNWIATGESPPRGSGKSETFFSPLFEGLFACEVYLCWNVVAFGGYQLLYLDRVDRAGGHFQGDVDQFTAAPPALGDLFLYGPRVGLLVSF